MNSADRTIARAQVLLSVVYVGGYFFMLWSFLEGKVKTPVEWRDQMGILLGVLTAGVGTILGFWFSRARPGGESSPPPPPPPPRDVPELQP